MKEQINVILSQAIRSKPNMKKLCLQIIEDGEETAEQYTGVLSPNVLQLLFSIRRKEKCIVVPWAIQYFGDTNSISYACFRKILRAPNKFRRACMISMAHIELPIYQLVSINQYQYTFESFDTLFFMICKFDCFTIPDMELLLSSCRQKREIIAWNIEHAEQQLGKNEKIAFAKSYF